MTIPEKLEELNRLLIEYMKPHASWEIMERIQELLEELGYPSKEKSQQWRLLAKRK